MATLYFKEREKPARIAKQLRIGVETVYGIIRGMK